jgi:hypothetical protein
VLAEFQTSRSEAHHWIAQYKLPLLGSYPNNLPSSAKRFHYIRSEKKIKNFRQ